MALIISYLLSASELHIFNVQACKDAFNLCGYTTSGNLRRMFSSPSKSLTASTSKDTLRQVPCPEKAPSLSLLSWIRSHRHNLFPEHDGFPLLFSYHRVQKFRYTYVIACDGTDYRHSKDILHFLYMQLVPSFFCEIIHIEGDDHL